MNFDFLVAPDFSPKRFSGWYMLNTLLQKRSGIGIHLLMPADRAEQAVMLAEREVGLVYANPFDAAKMVREHGYRAFARPVGQSDEMVIATAVDSPLDVVEDLQPGATIALTNNTDVKLIGLRLLEPADLTEGDIGWRTADSYQSVARQVMSGEVQALGFRGGFEPLQDEDVEFMIDLMDTLLH